MPHGYGDGDNGDGVTRLHVNILLCQLESMGGGVPTGGFNIIYTV